jgi:putative spermidine/putrescine transport system permease protein
MRKADAHVQMKTGRGVIARPRAWLLLPVLVFLAAFYIVPGALIVLIGAGHPPTFDLRPELLSLASWERVVGSTYYLRVLARTIMLGVVVGAIAAVFAYPVAYFLARSTSRFRHILYFLTLVPMAVGMNMITLGWLIILGRHGFINSTLQGLGLISQPLELLYTWNSMIIGLINVLFTFMVLPIAAVLKNIDPSVEQAARNLGANPLRTFIFVTLPLSFEGVAAGFLGVFMQASGAFVMPLLLGGNSNTILPVLIWEQYSVANDRNFAAALSLVLLIVAVAVLVLQMKLTKLNRAAAAP